MSDRKLYTLTALAAPGASDLFYTAKADGSTDGSITYTAMTAIFASTLSATFAASSHTHTASQVTDFSAAADLRVAAAVGVSVQAYNANLTTFAAIAPSANVQTFLGAANYAAMKTQLALTIGTDVQAYSAKLADIAGITYAQGDVFYYNGTNIAKLAAGTSGHFLKTQGAGANPVWAASSTTIADATYGDIVVTASGATWTVGNLAITTGKIAASAVTLAKIANASANSKLLGSGDAGSGAAYAEITLGSGLTMTGTTLAASAGAITVKEEGSNLTTALTSIDLVGGGVTGTNSTGAVTVTVRDYFSHRIVASAAAGSDISFGTTTSYVSNGNFCFGIDLDTFMPTHFRIIIISGSTSAATVTLQLVPVAAATSPLHTGGDDLAVSGATSNRDSGWRTFDNTTPLSGYQVLALANKSSSGTPNLIVRSIDILFKR